MIDNVVGEIEFTLRDAETEEVKSSWIEYNAIQEYGMTASSYLLMNFSSVWLGETFIPTHMLRSVYYPEASITSGFVVSSTSTYFTNGRRTRSTTYRFNPPPSTRTIRSAFLVSGTGASYTWQPLACTNLKYPCTQTPSDILDVTYKIVVALESSDAHLLVNDHNMNRVVNKNLSPFNYSGTVFLRPALLKTPYTGTNAFHLHSFNVGVDPFVGHSNDSTGITSQSADSVQGARSYEIRARYNVNNYPGMIAKYFALQNKYSSSDFLYYGYVDVEEQTQQKTYKHKRNGPLITPLVENSVFDSTGNVEVDTTNFNEEIPDFFEVFFETPGDVGTATYKLRRRKTFGFYNNTPANYVETSSSQETTVTTSPSYTETVLDEINGFYDVALSPSKQFAVGRLQTGQGVVRYDVYQHFHRSWSQTSTPSINVGSAFDYIITDDDEIWIRSSTTGITRIFNNGNSVNVFTQADGLPSLNVMAIQRGYNGKIWAIIADSSLPKAHLCYTVDKGHTWVVLNDTTTPQFVSPPSNPSQYKIFSDLSEDKVWIFSNATSEPSIWFDSTVGSFSGPTLSIGSLINPALPVIAVGGGTNKWYYSAYSGVGTNIIDFGSSAPIQVLTQSTQFLSDSLSYNGKTYVYSYAGTTLNVFDETGTVQSTTHDFQLSNYGIPYLDSDNGIIVVYGTRGQLKVSLVAGPSDVFDPILEGIWKTYGWNTVTSQWEVGAPAKTTHSSFENIPGGTRIRFVSGTPSADSFLTNETFTFVGHKGITVDGTEKTRIRVGLASLKNETITTFNDATVSLKTPSVPSTPVAATWVGSGNTTVSTDNVVTLSPVTQSIYENFSSAAYSAETIEGDFDVDFTWPVSLGATTSMTGVIPANLVNQHRVTSKVGTVILESWLSIPGSWVGQIRDVIDHIDEQFSSQYTMGKITSFVTDNQATHRPFKYTMSRRGRELYITLPRLTRLQPQDYYNIYDIFYRAPNNNYTLTYKYPINVTMDDFSYKIIATPFSKRSGSSYTYHGLAPTITYVESGIYSTRVGRQSDNTGSFNEFFAGVSFVGNQIRLNGIPVKIYNYEDKTKPDVGEAIITRDGYILFNSADAGKVIEGEVRVFYNPQKPVS